jgi:DNA-directed RNA polymerase specialized sigma24 family protein
MTSYLDLSDTALLTRIARLDRLALSELFRRYGAVVLVAGGWTAQTAATAEARTVEVFLDLWERPGAYAPGAATVRTHLIRAALVGASEEAVRLATARLAALEGWTYHDVADVLARSARNVATAI